MPNTDKATSVPRVTFKNSAGQYRLNASLKLSHTNIVGDGIAKTIIIQTGNESVFETVNDTRTTSNAGDQDYYKCPIRHVI